MGHEPLETTTSKKNFHIANFAEINHENCETLVFNIIWIFKYIYDLVIRKEKKNKRRWGYKNVPRIITKQFKYFKYALIAKKYAYCFKF